MDSLVVNGLGNYRTEDGTQSFGSVHEHYYIPRDQDSARLRLIHAGFEYQIVVFRVDGGNIIVRGSDGGMFEDIEVTEIIFGVGESYDVSVNLPDMDSKDPYQNIIIR